jgi:hypothetical protein
MKNELKGNFCLLFCFWPRTDVKFHWPGEGGTGRVSDENSPSPTEPALGGGNGRLLQSSKLLLLVSPDSARLLLPSGHRTPILCSHLLRTKKLKKASERVADEKRADFQRLEAIAMKLYIDR